MPDIAKIGTVATGNISKIGTLTYSDENISHVLGVDMPADGEGGGGDWTSHQFARGALARRGNRPFG